MIKRVHYTAHSRMADLLSEHYNIFSLISRLGIPLGMGDHTIREVCEANGVDTDTFMYLVHFDLYPDLRETLTPDLAMIDVAQIISFLRASHSYFLEVRLPDIGEALDVALEGTARHPGGGEALLRRLLQGGTQPHALRGRGSLPLRRGTTPW